MGPIPRIALRNVARNKRRTLLTVITMSFSMAIFIWMDCIMGGFDVNSVDSLVRYSESAIRVSTARYAEERLSSPLDYGFEDPAAAIAAIRGVDGVLQAAPRTRFVASASGPNGDKPIMAAALDPALDPGVFSIKERVEGKWLGEAEEPAVLLGAALAEKLGVGAGDYVTLFANSRYGTQRGSEFLVAGTFATPDPNLNASQAFISFADAEEFLDLEGLVTEIFVSIERPLTLKAFFAASDRAAASIRAALPGVASSSIGAIAADVLAISSTKRGFSYVLVVILLFISAVGIVNTVLMAVYARVREIGVLGAFGMKRREISALFLAEGTIIGVAGALGGVALGLILDLLAVKVGLPLDAMAGKIDTTGIPVWGTLYGEWNFGAIAFAFVFSLAVSMLASWIPAHRAGRMRITRALRFA